MEKEVRFTDEWHTPNTYDNNFKSFPHAPGVYVITRYCRDTHSAEILYIGSTKDIAGRLSRHEIRKVLSHFYDYMPIYFYECDNYKTLERQLIKRHRPEFNNHYLNG